MGTTYLRQYIIVFVNTGQNYAERDPYSYIPFSASLLSVDSRSISRIDPISPSQTSGFSQNFLINLDMFFVSGIAWDIWKPWS